MRRSALLLVLVGCGGSPPRTDMSEPTANFNFRPSEIAPSYEAWLEANHLFHAPIARWIEASAPLVGTRVRWPLVSSGGEGTFGEPFRAPSGWTGTERSLFVSHGLSDLAAVEAAGSAVVHCPGLLEVPWESTRSTSTVDGMFLGVVERNGRIEVWLGDCAVHP